MKTLFDKKVDTGLESNYAFRQRLLQVHARGLYDLQAQPGAQELALDESWQIAIAESCGAVLENAALDLQHYFYRSMGLSLRVKRYAGLASAALPAVVVATAAQLGQAWDGDDVSGACAIECTNQGGAARILIRGRDERGCAQGCYRLEDRFTQRRAPFLQAGEERCTPAFSPRMVHSGYGLDNYPDAHLAAIAHAGMDAILVFAKGVDQTPHGYLDFNELIARAANWGLDVYAYSYMRSAMHPRDAGAEDYYEGTYGQLFARCPGLKGVVLVGESVEFPSRDARVSDRPYYDNTQEGLPIGKPTAGWFPCNDYGEWISLLRKVIRAHSPKADIVFWTYNWGHAPSEDRLKLIDSLPKDISLMVTFEMYAQREVEGVKVASVDYTLSFPHAGEYFLSEARRAHERGLKLYTQANSAGLTWDFGVIPYEPCPMQWVKRYEAMLAAKRDYGLRGVMESHHYGYWPSFISQIEKMMFGCPGLDGPQALRAATEALYGPHLAPRGLEAWQELSDGITYYVSANEDQYGPLRIGPSYPMVFRADVTIPSAPHALFGGNAICFTDYACDALYKTLSHTLGDTGMIQQRIPGEIRCLEKMRACFYQGRAILESLCAQLEGQQLREARLLINLVHFMENCATTVIHVKQWNRAKWRVRAQEDGPAIVALLKEIQAIGQAEIDNAAATIPLVEFDSRLGWEPSMEYMTDRYHLEWKIRQTRQVIEEEIPRYIRQAGGQ